MTIFGKLPGLAAGPDILLKSIGPQSPVPFLEILPAQCIAVDIDIG